MQYPIFDLFQPVGMISRERIGLYYAYQAQIKTRRAGFLRLYSHTEEDSCRLGLFREEQGRLFCEGRISVRTCPNPENAFYSLSETPWRTCEMDAMPNGALSRAITDGREVIVPLLDALQTELVPYFCFLRKVIVEDIPCLSIFLDKQVRPFFCD